MATLPKRLAEAFRLYERHGFTVKSWIRGSKHYKVTFDQFPQVQYLTANQVDACAIKNNVARFKRLATKEKTNVA